MRRGPTAADAAHKLEEALWPVLENYGAQGPEEDREAERVRALWSTLKSWIGEGAA